MKRNTTIALLGVGGYGQIYVQPLLNASIAQAHHIRLIAAVDPNPHAADGIDALQTGKVPLFTSSAEMYAHCRPDVVVIASPIQFHCQQTVEALAHGAHVLCEKPLCSSIEDVNRMQQARDASPSQVAIGYQWSFCDAIQRLKADILAGVFGAPRRCKSLTLWPRGEAYYTRSGWAGRRATPSGSPVLDSPINNACAHFLHNMLYLLGPSTERSAQPHAVTAELYRANPIETFDTGAVRAHIGDGVELLMIASHATTELREPVFELEFDDATIRYSGDTDGKLIAQFTDGTTRNYGQPSSSTDIGKLWSSVQAFNDGTPVLCGIEAATPQTMIVCAAHASMPEAHQFPPESVRIDGQPGQRKTSVNNLGVDLIDCYETWHLPSELRLPWSAPGDFISIDSAANDAPLLSSASSPQAEVVGVSSATARGFLPARAARSARQAVSLHDGVLP